MSYHRSMADAPVPNSLSDLVRHGRLRDLVEILIAYALIMMVIWSSRAAQHVLWWLAAAGVFAIICLSFDGWAAVGMRRANLLRSLWIVGAALALSLVAIFAAARLGTLHLPPTVLAFVGTYIAYAVWSGVQQFLLQGLFLVRFSRLIPRPWLAALTAAVLFASAHLPSTFLAPITLVWGFVACLLFLRYRNLYPLALAHAILGITIAITVPGTVDHNMRVGLGYLTYRPHHSYHGHLPIVEPSPKQ
ncbi:MAG: CPBP family intramembrane glutamic endopeptidase [Terracidiphilus sp.]